MKKSMIMIAMMAAVLILTACSGTASTADSAAETTTVTEQTTTDTAQTTTVSEQTATTSEQTTESQKASETTVTTGSETTKTAKTTTTPAETAPQQTSAPAESNTADPELIKTADTLIRKYIGIADGYGAGNVDQYDINDSVPINEWSSYYRVGKAPFTDVQSVKDYLAEYLTGEALKRYMQQTFGEEYPLYTEKDGKLYASAMNKGAEFLDVHYDTLKLSNIKENSFTATVTEISYGSMPLELHSDMVKENGKFRVSKYYWDE